MTRFIHNTRRDRHYAVREITEIGAAKKYSNTDYSFYHVVKLRDGSDFNVDGHDIDDLTNPAMATIPALPGYSIIHGGFCVDGEKYFWRTPVIAWQIMSDGSARPVTFKGVRDNEYKDVPVESPDGEIYVPEVDETYSGEDAFLTYVREREERIEAERAAARAKAAVAKPEEQA